ncbi:putative interferon-induced protein with tetratricopeptide repeats 5-like [Apostichopus japonicus]|uniref:Putative interferon-induced protein with tetratricopeptide repeats 5-like n=1 Tax=Stichopus japonicus TaxID=307972 RepID=A0A2G8LN76_STIJA|nr:putative interferon-induced protein with tetratricopeptide repeats 5-like [Apostichopus japonicus]
MDDPEWWKKNPCPQHLDWGLHDISDLDHAKLKLHIDQDENAEWEMPIEVNIYRAALEYLDGKGTLFNRSRDSPTKALDFLQKAEDLVTSGESEEAITGYGVVINTFRMWLRPDSSVEATLKELEEKKIQFPKYEAYVTIVHAYILSRLGPRWRKKAIGLYEDALNHVPGKSQWLFGLALMIGREARQQRGVIGWDISLPNNIRVLFQKEKEYLEQVLMIDSQYHLAKAYYGQVLFNLNSDSRIQAEHELRQALHSDPTNTKIRILVAKFYKLNAPFLPQAENMLKELIKDVNIAEVHAQLGFLYRSQAYREAAMENRFVLYQKALECFQNAVKVDSCHYAALEGIGGIQANLGKVQEARKTYHDLLMSDFKDKPHQKWNEYKALKSAIKLKIFTPLERISFCHMIIQLAVGFTTDGDHIMTVPPSSLDDTNHRCLTTLENYSKQSGVDSNVTCQAQLKLANANLLLGNIEDAQTQYDNLYKPPPVEVIFGRGKCYVKTGIESNESDCEAWATVIQMAEELNTRNSRIPSDELYADVYLAKAKFITGGESAELLKRAIQKNSLEACYRYILSLQELQANFFNDISIPETLEEVKRVCRIGKPLHTQFTVELDDDSNVVPNLTTKKNFIQTAVDKVVNYDINIAPANKNPRLKTVLDKLRQLREYRMKYELELRLSIENKEWGEEYDERFLDVVEHTKRLLDKCISACQDLVTDNPPRYSLFLVVFDGKAGNVDKERCSREVTSWAKKKVKLPEYLLEKITKIQPMNDKKNMWLWAIHHLENWRKHSAERCDIGETYTIKVDSDSEFATLKTDDIVKDSCKGVVNLVVDLLNTCCEKSSEASTVAGDV